MSLTSFVLGWIGSLPSSTLLRHPFFSFSPLVDDIILFSLWLALLLSPADDAHATPLLRRRGSDRVQFLSSACARQTQFFSMDIQISIAICHFGAIWQPMGIQTTFGITVHFQYKLDLILNSICTHWRIVEKKDAFNMSMPSISSFKWISFVGIVEKKDAKERCVIIKRVNVHEKISKQPERL